MLLLGCLVIVELLGYLIRRSRTRDLIVLSSYGLNLGTSIDKMRLLMGKAPSSFACRPGMPPWSWCTSNR